LIDTHCHLTDPVFKDNLDLIISRAAEVGVDTFIVPSVDIATSLQAVAMAKTHRGVHGAAGIHPLWADAADLKEIDDVVARLAELVHTNIKDLVAIGEIGLDDAPGIGGSAANPAARRHAFVAQMGLARDFNLPVIIHSRGPVGELIDILEFFGANSAGGVLHAFSGSAETAARLRKLGYLRGVAGTVTRPEAARLREILAGTSCEDIVLETDAPWIKNALHDRGLVEPADLVLTATALAGLQRITTDALISRTDMNAGTLFRLTGAQA
jgi:TatD DNase family protein